jgi:hypothetical protein
MAEYGAVLLGVAALCEVLSARAPARDNMAMGPGFLGRGGAARVQVTHILKGAPGGVLTRAPLGWKGLLLGLSAWRTWFVGARALLAFGIGLNRRPVPLGCQSQVPRESNQTMPPGRRYQLSGAMLGCGQATPILMFAFLVLLSAHAQARLAVSALSGALFAPTRQAIALLPALCRLDSGATIGAAETGFRVTVRQLTATVSLDAGLMLVVLAWH